MNNNEVCCTLCETIITPIDIQYGFVKMYKGNWAHVHHLSEYISLKENTSIVTAADIFLAALKGKNNVSALACEAGIKTAAKQANISVLELKNYLALLCSEYQCEQLKG
jgi:hypothetical protein